MARDRRMDDAHDALLKHLQSGEGDLVPEADEVWLRLAKGRLSDDEIEELRRQAVHSPYIAQALQMFAPLPPDFGEQVADALRPVESTGGLESRVPTPNRRPARPRRWLWIPAFAVALLVLVVARGGVVPAGRRPEVIAEYEPTLVVASTMRLSTPSDPGVPPSVPVLGKGDALVLTLRTVAHGAPQPQVRLYVDTWDSEAMPHEVTMFGDNLQVRVGGGDAGWNLQDGRHDLLIALGPMNARVRPGRPESPWAMLRVPFVFEHPEGPDEGDLPGSPSD